MKRILSSVLVVLLLFSLVSIPFFATAEESDQHTRVINIVYDDSRSMFIKGNKAWCYAKYSMEVFAAMLSENDSMNIFCMSDAGSKPTRLNGKNGAAANVKQIYNMLTPCDATPFGTVKRAYSDLNKQQADEKWLVIFTDGSFDDASKSVVQTYINGKSDDVKVLFLSIGEGTKGIDKNVEKGIYFERAKNANEILNKITEICTIVFNSNKIPVNDKKKPAIEFDVPMRELTVFAQGKAVKINGIKDADGQIYQGAPVGVKNNKVATSKKNEPEKYVTEDLSGCVSTFYGEFNEGKYSLDVSGAETIEVYYKPDIDVSASLQDKSGQVVTELSELEAGEYNIDFFFVKSGTEKKIPKSSLLGNVTYEAVIQNAGETIKVQPGDIVKIGEGDLRIDVTAKYLEYNSVSTHLEYTIYKNKVIDFEVLSSPKYTIETNTIRNGSDATQIKLTLDGKEFTDEQWEQLKSPKLIIKNEENAKITNFKIEKAKEAGIINVYPLLEEGKTTPGEYVDADLEVKCFTPFGSEAWSGKTSLKVPFNDNRGWLEKNIDKVIKGLVGGILLFLILGYIPPFKKYLPKSLKKRPKIECKYKDYSIGVKLAKGKVIKDLKTTLCPYMAERGTIIYTPTGAGRAPALKVRAKNSSRMLIRNQNAFKDRSEITFNGSALIPSKKAKEIGAGVVITYTTPEATYTCIPKIK